MNSIAAIAAADPDTQDLDTLYGEMGPHQIRQTAETVACPSAFTAENLITPPRCQGTFPFGSASPIGVQLYYPADIDRLAKAPAIVFTPGIDADPGYYDAMLAQWASYGFVVAVSYDFVNTFSEMQFIGLAILRQRDLDPASPLAGRIDFGRILLAGHSAGGGSALLASNVIPRFQALDPAFRVVGALALEPGPLAITNFVTIPALIIENARDTVVPAGSWPNWYQYPGLSAAPAYLATRKAATHTDTQNPLLALNTEHSLAIAWLLTLGMRDPTAGRFFIGPDWKLPTEPNYSNVERNTKADRWQL
ncbi:alpha/beta hydrolase [Nocardia sp. NPDC051570]|uniref:poly(ethylene terephthalate) hydrolase family protein n=1 Tax=Nocardia sp. NPDC051570 TaxID=3364324 RepID=UPI0037A74B11